MAVETGTDGCTGTGANTGAGAGAGAGTDAATATGLGAILKTDTCFVTGGKFETVATFTTCVGLTTGINLNAEWKEVAFNGTKVGIGFWVGFTATFGIVLIVKLVLARNANFTLAFEEEVATETICVTFFDVDGPIVAMFTATFEVDATALLLAVVATTLATTLDEAVDVDAAAAKPEAAAASAAALAFGVNRIALDRFAGGSFAGSSAARFSTLSAVDDDSCSDALAFAAFLSFAAFTSSSISRKSESTSARLISSNFSA